MPPPEEQPHTPNGESTASPNHERGAFLLPSERPAIDDGGGYGDDSPLPDFIKADDDGWTRLKPPSRAG